jgi:hypothetical protein
MKRVAELELDLMQAQAVGAELTKRLLEKNKQHQIELEKVRNSSQMINVSKASTTSPSPSRTNTIPKIHASVQVDLFSSTNDNQNPKSTAALSSSSSPAIMQNDLAATYSARIEALEAENVALRDRLASSKFVLSNANQEDDEANNNNNNHNGDEVVLSQYRASPSRNRGRPMDDYELRCMQRLILENERLRADLHSLRRSVANGSQQVSQQQRRVSATGSSGHNEAAEEESHNILTVCFLTLRSVLGHHRAAEIVLSAIGGDEDQQQQQQQSEESESGKLSEVQTIEKLVYELACRIDSKYRGAPDEV